MKINLIGTGPGGKTEMTAAAGEALERSGMLVGASRLIDEFGSEDKVLNKAIKSGDILECIESWGRDDPEGECSVLFSGDVGFYSGARGLLALLDERDMDCDIYPGISSFQLFAARLGLPHQDWERVSAHGLDCDPVAEVCKGKPVFFLTGMKSAGSICAELTAAGLGELSVDIGVELTCPGEEIYHGKASEFADAEFDGLAVMLCQPAPVLNKYAPPGLPDECFIRGDVPMTKQEVRAVIMSKLSIAPGDVCWDVGAGTGSCSVEMALMGARVYAVEHHAEAVELIKKNRDALGAWMIREIVHGSAPEALKGLPKPDKVFVGGSDGSFSAVVDIVHEANPKAAICITSVTLETLNEAPEILENKGYSVEVIQVAVNRVKKAGRHHMLLANNPIFIITGTPSEE